MKGEISWQDFEKVQMHVGTVLQVESFPEARNPAYKIWIDFGPLGVRKSSAQLTRLYKASDLIGKQVVAVLNFAPKQIANFMSECLVLGAVDGDLGTALITTDTRCHNGTRIL